MANSILKRISWSEVPAVDSFVAKDKFRVSSRKFPRYNVDAKEIDGVMISGCFSFNEKFAEKVETNVPAAMLQFHELTDISRNAPALVLAELGQAAEIKLAHLWELLKRQPDGRSGELYANGNLNVTFIRGDNDILWSVIVHNIRDDDGWFIQTSPIDKSSGWGLGGPIRVISY